MAKPQYTPTRTMNTPATMPTIHESTVTTSAAEALRSTQCRRYQSTICTKPAAVNTIEKNMPRANHDVFQALVNGGIARQKLRFRPRYRKCSGSLKSTMSTQPTTVVHQAQVVMLPDPGDEADEVRAHAEGGEDLGEPHEDALTGDPLRLAHGLDHPLVRGDPLAAGLGLHDFTSASSGSRP